MEIAPGIHWIGAVDWAVRFFHGYELSTHRGTSYNAFLIKDRKIAVVDGVWAPFTDDYINNIRRLVDPERIEVVVANHSEPDHSGSLPELMKLCPNATVVVSRQGRQSIPGHYHRDWNFKVVGTGDTVSLGERELVFVEAGMLHWPDTMFTYVRGDGILMPNDAFGQHYAAGFRFNDQVNREELYYEAMKYYANIITPYSDRVRRKIDELLAMKLPISMIAPSHGILWRDDPLQIVRTYQDWAAQKGRNYAVILFDTMWQATRKMAEAVADGLAAEGIEHKLYHMAVSDHNDVLTDIFQARAVIIGSPAHNNHLLPSIMPILEDIKGLRFQNKLGAAFGSYGWSGECTRLIEEHLAEAKIPLAAPSVKVKWQPSDGDLATCRNLGRQVAAAIKNFKQPVAEAAPQG